MSWSRKRAALARGPRLRFGVLVVLFTVAVSAGLWLRPVGPLLEVAQWRDGNALWTPLLYVLLFGVAALFFVPRPALAAVAGLLFSTPIALVVVVVGTVVGAGLAFGIARTLGREALAPRLRRGRLNALDSLFARRGFTATVLCRLLPVLPYAVINYGAGVTRVGILPFLAGTAVGTLPANITYVTAGSVLASDPSWTLGSWLALAAAAVAGAGWAVRRLMNAKRTSAEGEQAGNPGGRNDG